MLRTNDEIGPYVLIKQLGTGAFGEVWLAEKRTAIATSQVAVKIPLQQEPDLEAIKQEATLWTQIGGHPNVLPMIEANIYDEHVVIVSEYAPDGSLEHWMRKNSAFAIPTEVALKIADGILSGLEHLHSKRVVHRDLKPANILLQGETPRLADFGLSRILKTTLQSTNAAGTPAYMAPEAFDGKKSIQTDLWAAGVIVYQLLTGKLPFPSKEYSVLIAAILTKEPQPLPPTLKHFQHAITKALDKKAENRYQSANEMKLALQKCLVKEIQPPIKRRTIPFYPSIVATTLIGIILAVYLVIQYNLIPKNTPTSESTPATKNDLKTKEVTPISVQEYKNSVNKNNNVTTISGIVTNLSEKAIGPLRLEYQLSNLTDPKTISLQPALLDPQQQGHYAFTVFTKDYQEIKLLRVTNKTDGTTLKMSQLQPIDPPNNEANHELLLPTTPVPKGLISHLSSKPYPSVQFSHATHSSRTNFECNNCHVTNIKKPGTTTYPNHQECSTCHNTNNTPANNACEQCHNKESAFRGNNAQINMVYRYFNFSHTNHLKLGKTCNECHDIIKTDAKRTKDIARAILTKDINKLHKSSCFIKCHDRTGNERSKPTETRCNTCHINHAPGELITNPPSGVKLE